MSDDKKVSDTVREMAKLSLLSNKISEIQEKNLKMYPLIFFDGVKSASIDYDLSSRQDIITQENRETVNVSYNIQKPDTSHFRVSYHLDINENADNSNLERRFASLESAVRSLFWNNLTVEVYFGTELKYKSKK